MKMIRHVGIYVDDIDILCVFYKKVFHMIDICNTQMDHGEPFDELYGYEGAKVLITKLITPFGKKIGNGQMIELIHIINYPVGETFGSKECSIMAKGTAHIAFEVDDIDDTVCSIEKLGGRKATRIYERENGNKICFCCDPEGNWLELIWRGIRV